jgi:DNA-binding NtrC family response regulator
MDARLIALTNTDLSRAVATGRFREDLFFRLNVLSIVVPPLRERRKDIPALAIHFLARLAPVHGRADASFASGTLKCLEAYGWPGNARELKNAVEHALIFGKESQIGPTDFPEIVRAGGSLNDGSGHLRSLKIIESEAIKKTLEATHYKIGKTAEILGVSRKTLLEKRKKYKLLE